MTVPFLNSSEVQQETKERENINNLKLKEPSLDENQDPFVPKLSRSQFHLPEPLNNNFVDLSLANIREERPEHSSHNHDEDFTNNGHHIMNGGLDPLTKIVDVKSTENQTLKNAPILKLQHDIVDNGNVGVEIVANTTENIFPIIKNNVSIPIIMIYTNVEENAEFKRYLLRAIRSILNNTSSPIKLYLITDKIGFQIFSDNVTKSFLPDHFTFELIDAEAIIEEFDGEVNLRELQTHFTSKKFSYYKNAVFFFTFFIQKFVPATDKVIILDIDIVVRGDIAELYSHFLKFKQQQFIGLAYEMSPVYRHILSLYRSKNPETLLGMPISVNGFPGYNSGVILMDVPRFRDSVIKEKYLNGTTLEEAIKKYYFKGHLGDQDLYNLIALDHPEIFYTLPCVWNRQLCQWWRNKGYQEVFDLYYSCEGDVKLLHGNCKTEIKE